MALRSGDIPEGINVSPTHPLKEFGIFVGSLLLILALLLWLLGGIGSYLAAKLPARYEAKLGKWFTHMYADNTIDAQTGPVNLYVQQLLDRLVATLPAQPLTYQVRIHCTKQKNAFALPGGTIVIFSELLKQLKSEPELAMLLGHELGHQVHRDHLHGLGRSLAIFFPMLLLGVSDQSGVASKAAGLSAQMLLLHHSRAQEESADDFGLQLVTQLYPEQRAAGLELFRTLAELAPELIQSLPSWTLTHPQPMQRYLRLKTLLPASALRTATPTIPLPAIKNFCQNTT